MTTISELADNFTNNTRLSPHRLFKQQPQLCRYRCSRCCMEPNKRSSQKRKIINTGVTEALKREKSLTLGDRNSQKREIINAGVTEALRREKSSTLGWQKLSEERNHQHWGDRSSQKREIINTGVTEALRREKSSALGWQKLSEERNH